MIDEALRLLKKEKDVEIRAEELPLDDEPTFELLSRGLTSGVFQFESEGMRDILRRYKPERLEDLIALNALYRPGPIQGGMISDFIDRRHGRKPVKYELPVLRDLLEETYGVIVYQEQVMQIANVVAGYSLGEADLLRRAMGKKKAAEMKAQRERFVKGALERGYPKRKVVKLFDTDGEVRGLRLQQVTRRSLWLRCVRDGLPESPLPGLLYGGPALLGKRQHRQDREVHQ